MKSKEKYQKLDDVGIVGIQEKNSTGSQAYHKKKTGKVLQQLRNAAVSRNTKHLHWPAN